LTIAAAFFRMPIAMIIGNYKKKINKRPLYYYFF